MAAAASPLRAGSTPRTNVVALAVLILPLLLGLAASIAIENPAPVLVLGLVGAIAMQSPRVANQWERAIVLRLGRYIGLRGPGLFWIVPFIDTVSSWIDQRTITTTFAAEQTLTSDTVPVNVDAVLFWMVYDAEKAALEVQDYANAVSWAAQTALRDIIGRTALTDLLRGRERIEDELQKLIDERSNPWGVTVQSVEMRDVVIPGALQDAMSREAQASREKQARIILGQAEIEIAALFEKPREVVPGQSDRAAPARHEHAVRRTQGKRRADARFRAAPSNRWAWAGCWARRRCDSRMLAGGTDDRRETGRTSPDKSDNLPGGAADLDQDDAVTLPAKDLDDLRYARTLLEHPEPGGKTDRPAGDPD